MNEWTIGLAGGLLEGSLIRYAADIAKALDDGENLRVIPLVTYGAVSNVNDLLSLRGVDVAFTQADVLDHLKRALKVPNIENKIRYISPLFRSEAHIYAREEFRTLKDLEGKKVSFGLPGMAANLTGADHLSTAQHQDRAGVHRQRGRGRDDAQRGHRRRRASRREAERAQT